MKAAKYFSDQAKLAILGYILLSVSYFVENSDKENEANLRVKVLNYVLMLFPILISIYTLNCVVVGVDKGGVPCHVLSWLNSGSILVCSILILVITLMNNNGVEKYTTCAADDKVCLAYKKCDDENTNIDEKLECYKKIFDDSQNSEEQDDVSRTSVSDIHDGTHCQTLTEKDVNCTDESGQNNVDCCGEGAYADIQEINDKDITFGVIDDPAYDEVMPDEIIPNEVKPYEPNLYSEL